MERNISVAQEDIDIPKALECSICGGLFDKAVSLKACGHTYCSLCIRSHWLTTSRPGIHRQSKKECPLCRTSTGSDVNNALVINHTIQRAVNAFKPAQLPPSKTGSYGNESPINKRMQSRNYSGMKRNGKKELQRICKEYNLATSGNEQELVDRLRCFECMWNAELDTIDTPVRPSELVAKFKEKESMLRKEKSLDIMTGRINHQKHMKKLKSSLLNDDNKRNDKAVSETSSGNEIFDAKFKSNFAELISQGRRRMKKESYWSSSRNSAGPRTYADDGIHDRPKETTDIIFGCQDEGNIEISAATSNVNSLEQTSSDDLTKIKSSVGINQLLQNKKSYIYNPYKSECERKLQNPFVRATTNKAQSSIIVGQHIPNKTSAKLKPVLPSPKENSIYNPYQKKQLLQHQTPSAGSTTRHNAKRRKFESESLKNSQSIDEKCRDRIPLARGKDNLNFTTNMNRNKIDHEKSKTPRLRSTEVGVSTDDAKMNSVATALKRKIRNPYRK